MNFYRTLASSLIGLALAGASLNALGAAAVAVGNGGYSHAVFNVENLDEAKERALAECQRNAQGCELSVWSSNAGAIALAKSPGGTISILRDTPEAARDAAMTMCRKEYKSGCKFAALYWETGGQWAAWATSKTQDGNLLSQEFAYGFDNEAQARKVALDGCAARMKDAPGPACTAHTRIGAWTRAVATSATQVFTYLAVDRAEARDQALNACRADAKPGETCKIIIFEHNTASRAKPRSFDKVFAQTELARERAAMPTRARPSAPPRGTALTCTNRCVNGSCVRTFANGHTERWEAPRVFDPFSRDWKWDTSSCGG